MVVLLQQLAVVTLSKKKKEANKPVIQNVE